MHQEGLIPPGLTDLLSGKALFLLPLLGCVRSAYSSSVPNYFTQCGPPNPAIGWAGGHPRYSLRIQGPCESHVVQISFRNSMMKARLFSSEAFRTLLQVQTDNFKSFPSMAKGKLPRMEEINIKISGALGRYTSKCFILFVAMVNGIVSLISLSVFSLLVYRNARDFLC